ncbi:TWiK family of potassium channels protein 18 [Toxocara canis]|uniref:TWiK family of potassium channels protein 18 n=1 Tax=Toxocara canis TaxID=6265 RepID=A0A0B2W353_TOXCA|nr:TWiK family of potassium channels protein 18 [Toxocara canis]
MSFSVEDILYVKIVVEKMLQRIGNQCESIQLERSTILREKPDDCFGKTKYYYEKFNLRYIAPFVLLLIYSILGAALFYWVEYDNERELLRREAIKLERLRNETFHRLKEVMTDRIRSDQTKLYNSRDVLVWYEKQLAKLHLSDGLEWDMWGALFYVGTLFTTIGYGNIAPRTAYGQALSIVYALIGIPLVLAILSQFGRTLTNFVSNLWIRYRQCIKGFAKRKRIAAKTRASRMWGERSRDKYSQRELLNAEEGNAPLADPTLLNNQNDVDDQLVDEDELLESRTIPVWLALFLCVAWICLCAGLFCLWETRWSYFTSLYFFFISLSTIGLGDVVPDHPHMLILMFWLVIIGLSIVSMLLSVIQIKMEEWLYHLMIRMQRWEYLALNSATLFQKEYQRALASGDPIERQAILDKLMKKEPWFMRNMAQHLISENQAAKLDHQKEYQRALASGDPIERQAILDKLMKKEPWFMRNMAQHLISENQAAKLDHQAEAFERCVRQMNNKNIQTEPSANTEQVDETQVDHPTQNNVATDGRSLASEAMLSPRCTDMATQWSKDNSSELEARLLPVNALEKATSVGQAAQHEVDNDSISDVPSLPLDESSPEVVDKSMQVSAVSCADRSQQVDPLSANGCGVQTDIAQFQVDEIMLKLHDLQAKSKIKPVLTDRSMETSLQGIGAKDETSEETDKTEQITQSTQYDFFPVVVDISITADLNNETVDEGIETEQNEYLLNRSMETDAWMAQLQMPECSRSVQTHFDDDEVNQIDDLTTRRQRLSRQQRTHDNERSTQCEIETADTCDTCVQTMLEMRDFDTDSINGPRSSSVISLRGSIAEEPVEVTKQDLIIQTDDSYLKIARRLDEIRNNRTASLHICVAKPLAVTTDNASNTTKQRPEKSPDKLVTFAVDNGVTKINEETDAADTDSLRVRPDVS